MVMQTDRKGLQELVAAGAQLVDVLALKEYEAEHIPGAINIPLKTLGRETARQLDSGRPVIVYCHDYQWDMSARAAARLETLGFRQVYRYQPGKADWFAAGLPREGRDAHTPRVGDVARRDVPTCGLAERVGDAGTRVPERGSDVCVVVDDQRVVLGLVSTEALGIDPSTAVEEVMDPSPVTFRPHLGVGELPAYVKTPRTRALVTTSDGVLIGLLQREGEQAGARSWRWWAVDVNEMIVTGTPACQRNPGDEMAKGAVTLYWSTTWTSCHAAKEFLSQKGVTFEAKNVAEDRAAREELIARTGRMAVPVIVVGDEVVVGFDRGRLQRLLGI